MCHGQVTWYTCDLFPQHCMDSMAPWIGSYKEREGFQRLSAQINTHRIHGAGIYANIWGILMVNVTIYGIHGSYGTTNRPQKKTVDLRQQLPQ